MAGIAGNAASFKISTNIVLEMSEWSLDIERNVEDDTEFGDTWEAGVTTLGKWSGTVKGRWGADGTQQAAMQTAILNGTSIAARFYVNGSNYYSGTAYVTKQSPAATVGGLVEIEFGVTGTGALTYT